MNCLNKEEKIADATRHDWLENYSYLKMEVL